MYSKEYTWTDVDTDVTTISIIEVKLSKQNDQFMHKVSEATHKQISILYTSPVDITWYKRFMEINKGTKTPKVV